MAKTVSRKQIALEKGSEIEVIRYLRVSQMQDRTLTDEAFHSPELQITAIDAEFDTILGRGRWKLAQVDGNYTAHGPGTWADFDVSGTSFDRAGLDAALDYMERAGGVDVLGVLNLSRWGRNLLGSLQRANDLQKAGAWLISAREKSDWVTAEGRFMIHIFLAAAELFAGQKAAEWSDLIERRAGRGQHHGKPPAGYTRTPAYDDDGGLGTTRFGRIKTKGDIFPDPEARPHFVHVFEMFADGKPRIQGWKYLHDHGLYVSNHSLMGLLTNRAYLRWHAPECVGKECTDPLPHGDRGEVRSFLLEESFTGKRKRRLAGSEEWRPGRHEGIIEPELWQRVQDRLEKLDRRQRVRLDPKHELAGCVRCADCFRIVSTERKQPKRGRERVVMRCFSGSSLGCPGIGTVWADAILDLVLDDLRRIVARAEEPLVAAYGKHADRPRPGLKVDVTTLSRRRSLAIEAIAEIKTKLDLGEYVGTKEEAQARLTKLNNAVEDFDVRIAAAIDPQRVPIDTGMKQAADLLHEYESLSVVDRNFRFRSLVTAYVCKAPEGWQRGDSYAGRLSIRWSWEK